MQNADEAELEKIRELAEALRQLRAGELGEEYIPSGEDLEWARRESRSGGTMENQSFRCVGVVTVGGKREECELFIMPPAGKGGAWALTEAVRLVSDLADEGTEHHGVWCYFA